MKDLMLLTSSVPDLHGRLERREEIAWIEQRVAREEQVHVPTIDRLADGLYIREIHIPKGMTLVGRIHLQGHVSIIVKGDITIITETGTERIVGPRILISPPGTKRVGIAHEDTIWTTVHATAETDLETILEKLTVSIFPTKELSLCPSSPSLQLELALQ
jgi:quercetin dioxygenase-like cupin family protein